MLKEERHQKLLKVLAEKEFATVEELSKSLLVSMPTIRRDLTELARRKLIIRNHGGSYAHSDGECDSSGGLPKERQLQEKESFGPGGRKICS